MICKDQIVDLTVVFVTDDACWGTVDGTIGFVHCTGWSKLRPIPEDRYPIVNQILTVRIIRMIDPKEALPAWSTFDGKFDIKFAAAVPECFTDSV